MPVPQPAPAQPQPQQGPQASPGGASQLVADIHDKLLKLSDMVQGAGLPDEDVQSLNQIIKSFEQLVENLGKPSGQEEASEPDEGTSSPEAGGNPNAKPAY